MEITLEQIDLLRKRANVSYKEAKEALEKCGGNIVEALAFLEEENKIKPEKECTGDAFFQKTKRMVKKSNKISFTITRNEKTILNIPLTLFIVLAIISLPLVIAALLLAIFTDCKIRFTKENGAEYAINKNIENFSGKVNDITSKVTEEIKNA